MGNPWAVVLKHKNSWSTKELHQQPWQQLCNTVIITSIALVTTAGTESQNSTSKKNKWSDANTFEHMHIENENNNKT